MFCEFVILYKIENVYFILNYFKTHFERVLKEK